MPLPKNIGTQSVYQLNTERPISTILASRNNCEGWQSRRSFVLL